MSAQYYHSIECTGAYWWITGGIQSTVHVHFEEVVDWAAASSDGDAELVHHDEQVANEADFTFHLFDLCSPDVSSDAIIATVAGLVSCPDTARSLAVAILSRTRHELGAALSDATSTMSGSLSIHLVLILNTIRVVGDGDDEMDRLYLQEVENSENAAAAGAGKVSIEALDRVKFVGGEDQNMSCAICIDEFSTGYEITKMPCCHLFHHECIQEWLQRRNSCPLCRFCLPAETASSNEFSDSL